MENLEIILLNFDKNEIETFIFEDLKMSTLNVKSSHFYDNRSGEDLEFSQVKDIRELLSPKGTGNIFLKQLLFGTMLNDVMVVFSFDETEGDIVLNFPEYEIVTDDSAETRSKLEKLVKNLVELRSKRNFTKAIIGYEPAYDEDTRFIEIDHDPLDLDKVIDKIL